MKSISLVLSFIILSHLIYAQSGYMEVEEFDKRFGIVINNPSFSIHNPTGLIYEDTDGSAFTNLSDNLLRIADGPFGFQSQPNNVIYSQITKNSFSINHYSGSNGPISIAPSQRAFWGPRNTVNPFEYDMNTYGDIWTKNVFSQRLSELTNSSGTGALKLYKHSGGTTIHTLTIDVNGNPAWTAISDRRAKENITNIQNVLPRVRNLQMKNYNYLGSDVISRGYIAQEVQELFPDLVAEADNGMLAVNYMGFGTLAVQAIKEQQEIIESLEERIARLEKLIQKK